jgi:DNA-binding transcriptional LysR family regulator
MDFDLNLLPVVLAIYEERSVSLAAIRLGMSQPTVSVALNKLRDALEDPLFVRTSHGMEPTPRAMSLIAPTKEVLQRIDAEVLSSEVFDPALTKRNFTFAMSDIGEMVFLPKLVERIRVSAPQASVSSVNLSPSEIAAALETGEIDLAVGYFPDLKNRNFYQQRLFSHSFICLLNAAHPIKQRRITLEQFLKLGHAVIRAESRSQELFEQILKKQKIQRRIVLTTPHFMTIPFTIASTDLIVTVPRAVGEAFAQFANIKLIEPPFEIPNFDLKQHWHRKYHKDGASMWLRSIVLEIFGGR